MSDLPRLLKGSGSTKGPLDLAGHRALHGPMPHLADLIGELDRAGLRGRGGAAFPTATKAALVAKDHARHRYVVVNAMEGEPAAHKDRTLLSINPHLVLDGAEALAQAIGAKEIAICVARENSSVINHVNKAVHEREGQRRHQVNVMVHTPPGRYIAGEESALVNWLDDNETLPLYRPQRPSVPRIGRAPVLVDNAETHANVALIARHGASWFRELGTNTHPGSQLVSITGAVERPVVTEVALGTPLRQVLAAATLTGEPAALLLGGYGGTFVDTRALELTYDNDSLATIGASVGAGVIVVIPKHACGVSEIANITRWMANESARQCGPCAFGLPAMADSLVSLAAGKRGAAEAITKLRSRMSVISGRGACRHPDGVVRLVASALSVFGSDVAEHASGRPCAAAGRNRFAAVPRLERESELEWE